MLETGSAVFVRRHVRFRGLHGAATAAALLLLVAPRADGQVRSASSVPRVVRPAVDPTPPLTVTTLAGPESGPGWFDGTGSAARFSLPTGVVVDASGNVHVSDRTNHTIRKLSPAGVGSTLAGLEGTPGSADGRGATARFNAPWGVAVDSLGIVYVADYGNNTIRRVMPDGIVTTLAGLAGTPGSADGTGTAARFSSPMGPAVLPSGDLLMADNHAIRKVTPGGVVTTLAGLAGTPGSADGTGTAARFSSPSAVAVDGDGNAFVADTGNHTIRKVTPDGTVTTLAGLAPNQGSTDGTGTAARFRLPSGVAVDAAGNVYVGDTMNHTIRMVTSAGVVTTLAGLAQTTGTADGTGTTARFNWPRGVAAGNSGTVYVADYYNSTIRAVTAGGVVTTFAGLAAPWGHADGTGTVARFNGPAGVAVDAAGDASLADEFNHVIRKVTPAGTVSTLAGLAGTSGSSDGTGTTARFNRPQGVTVDGAGTVTVADYGNHAIRQVTSAGVVTSLAGLPGTSGTANGTGTTARFNNPAGIARDGAGNFYVADRGNHAIRVVTPGGDVTTLAGLPGTSGSADGTGTAARFYRPQALALDGAGNVYVADSDNQTIRKVTPGGVVTTLAGLPGSRGGADGTGSAARFNGPFGVATDGAGTLYVADYNNNTLRTVTPSGVVSTLLGLAGTPGAVSGTGTAARLYGPRGVALGPSGKMLVADALGHALRVARSALADVATIDQAVGPVGQPRQLDTAPQTATSWLWEEVRFEPGSAAALSSTGIRNPTLTPDRPGNFVFRLTASDGVQTSITTVSLTAYGPATATVSGGGTVCAGQPATIQAALTGTPPWSVLWSDGVLQSGLTTSPATRSVSPSQTTVYTVTAVADESGAGTSSGAATVTVNPVPTTPVIAAPPSAAAGASGLAASVVLNAGDTYSWAIQNGSITAGQGTNAVTFTAGTSGATVLTVVETNGVGCSAVATASVPIAAVEEPRVVNLWTKLGPDGGDVTMIAVDPLAPQTVWTTAFSGVFKSMDGGGHWVKLLATPLPAYAVALHPTNSAVAFAADGSRRLFRTTDGGASWSQSGTGITPGSASTGSRIAFRPGDAAVVYYAAGAALFKSTDSGATWATISSGVVTGKSILDLAVDPTAPDTVTLVLSLYGPHRTTDGGATWVPATTGLPTSVSGSTTYVRVTSFAQDPGSPGKMFVTSGQDGRIYATANGGGTWAALSAGALSATSLLVAPGDGQTLYAGAPDTFDADPTYLSRIWKSTDGGTTWGSVTETIWSSVARPWATEPGAPHTLYAAFASGLSKTTDGGGTWRDANESLRASAFGHEPGFDPSSPATWFVVGVSNGIFKTTDGGTTTLPVNGGLAVSVNGTAVVDPADPQIVLAGGSTKEYLTGESYMFLVRSSDGGATWKPIPNTLYPVDFQYRGLQPWGFVAVPTTPTTFYVSAPPEGVYKSTDAGLTFSPVNTGLPVSGGGLNFFNLDAADPTGTVLYLAGAANGVFKTTDGGATWATAGTGIPAGTTVRHVAVRPSVAARVFAATLSGLYRSTDSGSTWGALTSGIPAGAVQHVWVDSTSPSIVYATGTDTVTGVWIRKSTDGGDTWYAVTTAGLDLSFVSWLAVDPAAPARLLASGRGGLSQITFDATDPEGDGVPGSVESQVPSLGGTGTGDGNGDGVPDTAQGNVASLPAAVGGGWLTVESAAGTTLSGVRATTPPDPAGLPPGVTLSSGTLGFSVSGLAPGACTAVTLYAPLSAGVNGYFKHGPTPRDTTPRWYYFSYDGVTGAEVFQEATRTRVVLHLCDGRRGDSDVVVNGTITDPGGPAAVTVATASVSGGASTCAGQSAQVQASLTGAPPWSVSWSDGQAETGLTTSPVTRTVSPVVTTTYTVTALTDAVGAGISGGEATVTVNPVPGTPAITAPARVGTQSPNWEASVAEHAGSTYAWTIGNGTITSGQGTSRVVFTSGGTGTLTLGVVETGTGGCVSGAGATTVEVLDAMSAIRFYTLAPCRLLDTREADGPLGGPGLAAAGTRSFAVGGVCGIPSGARSISTNVTVVSPEGAGFLTLYPTDQPQPLASTINFRQGQTRANNTQMPVSQDGTGSFTVFNGSLGTTHLIVDVNGYFE